MKNKFVVLIGIFVLLFFLSVSFVAGFAFSTVVSTDIFQDKSISDARKAQPLDSDLKQVREIMGHLAHSYVDKVSKDELVDGAISGMMESLKDPYTKHMKNEDYAAFQEHTSGQFGGIGIEIGIRKKRLTVINPIPDTPAANAGVIADDVITTIESTPTKDMPLETAVKLIRGPLGTKVKLGFEREGKKDFSRTITRGQIKIANVTSKVIDDDLGYIKVHAFNTNTSKDVAAELAKVKKKKIKGVIVDMRNNPGGLLNEAVAVTSVFIKDKVIVSVKSREGKAETLAAGHNADTEIPLVVLVNGGSASASEIFAGAIKDHKRGSIVGERTFGKGSVQTVVQLSNGDGLILTTAKYMTPSGKSLHKKGIKPNVVIKLPKKLWHDMGKKNDPQLIKAQETLRDLIAGKTVAKAGK